jgi:CelD/BcsL family acetyltransferase involved in cellulose biosynthesis
MCLNSLIHPQYVAGSAVYPDEGLAGDKVRGTVRVSVIRPGELGPAEIAAWHSMQQATPSLANPFLSPEFAVAVGQVRSGARVAVLTEGQSITGFFPFERRQLSTGVPICGWLTPCQGLIHAPGLEWDPRELLRGCRLSAWRFDNLLPDQRPFIPYHTALVASPTIDLSDGFDAYYAKLRVKSARFCREIDRRTRKLGREWGELRVVSDSRDPNALRTLLAWKSAQYRQTSHVDRFEQPWLTELLDTLLATRSAHASGLLSVLYAGDQPVAAQFGLRAGSLLVGWFTAYETSLHSYSPGLIHLRKVTEELAADGIRVIDMGAGAKNYYKETLKSDDNFIAQGIVTGRSVLGAAHRARSALTWSARRTLRARPGLHHAADQILRRSGVAQRIYGRI